LPPRHGEQRAVKTPLRWWDRLRTQQPGELSEEVCWFLGKDKEG
jgi:hypothetical protein